MKQVKPTSGGVKEIFRVHHEKSYKRTNLTETYRPVGTFRNELFPTTNPRAPEATVKKCVFVEDGFKCLRESIFSVFNSCLPEYNELACFQLIVSGAHGTRASATGPADRETGDGPGRWLCRPRTEAGVPASLLRRFLATAARAQVRNAVQ